MEITQIEAEVLNQAKNEQKEDYCMWNSFLERKHLVYVTINQIHKSRNNNYYNDYSPFGGSMW
jgi:hypothetical protein